MDTDWLIENKGFGISDAHVITEAFTRLQNCKVVETIKTMPQLDPSRWTALPGFTFSLAEIAKESGISQDVASAVLAALTAPMPPTNEAFTSLGEFNVANAFPILLSPSGDYISLQSYGIAEALLSAMPCKRSE
jgi:hypothetical protein